MGDYNSPTPLPGLIVIGPMKSGTTWLDSYFRQRGDICLPCGVKETFFFDRNCDKNLSWYIKHFKHYDPLSHNMIVEVSPSYFPGEHVPARVMQYFSQVKVIVIVRDPVKRAWSHYKHMLRYGYTQSNLAEAIKQFPVIVDASKYAEHIARWNKFIPAQSMWIGSFELLKNEPEKFCMQCCEFLDIPYIAPLPADLPLNASATPRFYTMAKISRLIANLLRRKQLYFIVNAAKMIGLKKLAFGGLKSKRKLDITDAERDLLIKNLLHDMRHLSQWVDVTNYRWYPKYLE